jgi:hypothetical protein
MTSGMGDELAERAAERVREVIAEAERRAGEIVREAEDEAARVRERAEADARQRIERARKALDELRVEAEPPPVPEPEAPPEPEPEGEPIAAEPAAGERGSEERAAMLVAMKMAVDGATREQIVAWLNDEIPKGRREEIADEVMERAKR